MTQLRDDLPTQEIAPVIEKHDQDLAAPVDDKALAVVLRSQGVPSSAWPGTLAKMSDRVKGELVATLEDGRATAATRRRYDAWKQDRATKIRKARG